ncbi:MAG: DnaJ domain-containing protein, partial [Acidobacteria bacterium]|nr:DnaJ domain-containing protein [Acidobacteriota bacterium]
MSDTAVLDLFRQSGALLEGHFRLSSGLHSPRYLQSALVLQHPAFAFALGEAIASRARSLGATVVLSPALGGIVIGQEAARALGVAVTADPDACKRAYRRLALEHHPDVGGDPDRFQLLQRAYERLVAEHDGPRPPSVARGTPSRPPVPFVDETEVADLGSIDWD